MIDRLFRLKKSDLRTLWFAFRYELLSHGDKAMVSAFALLLFLGVVLAFSPAASMSVFLEAVAGVTALLVSVCLFYSVVCLNAGRLAVGKPKNFLLLSAFTLIAVVAGYLL